jgi:hypothetical protein
LLNGLRTESHAQPAAPKSRRSESPMRSMNCGGLSFLAFGLFAGEGSQRHRDQYRAGVGRHQVETVVRRYDLSEP